LEALMVARFQDMAKVVRCSIFSAVVAPFPGRPLICSLLPRVQRLQLCRTIVISGMDKSIKQSASYWIPQLSATVT